MRVLLGFLAIAAIAMVGMPRAAQCQDQTFTGKLDVLQVDGYDSAYRIYSLEVAKTKKKLKLRFRQEPAKLLLSGTVIRARGRLRKNGVLEVNGAGSIQIVQAAAAAMSGQRKAVVLILGFSDAAVGCTKSAIESLMFTGARNIDKFYQETSFGNLFFPGDTNADGAPDVFGPLAVNATKAAGSCDYSGWASLADSAAQAAGVNLSLYQHRIYVLPNGVDCSWAGLGNLGCGTYCRAWVKGDYCNLQDVYAHELGHNVGLHHASTDANNDGVIDSEYGDTSCTMGYGGIGWRHFNAPHIEQLGWFPTGNVQTVAQNGSFTITAGEILQSTLQVLKIARPVSGDYYYVSFRAPVGDHSVNLPSAYQYRTAIHHSTGSGYSYLVKTLGTGESYTDAANGVTITQTGSASYSATVSVSLSCAARAPGISLSPSKFVTNTAGSRADFTATVTNNDSSCGASTIFSLQQTLPAGWTGALSSATVTLSAGQSGAVGLSVSPAAGAAQGAYGIVLSAADSDGVEPAHAAAAANASYVFDQAPPAAITNLSASISRKTKVQLAWSAPAEPGGAGIKEYLVQRNGSLLTRTLNTNYVDAQTTAGAAYSYVVLCADNAGNVSAPSNSAQVTLSGRGKK